MVRPGETAIVVMPPSKRMEAKKTSKKRSAQQRQQAEPERFGFFDGFRNFVGLI